MNSLALRTAPAPVDEQVSVGGAVVPCGAMTDSMPMAVAVAQQGRDLDLTIQALLGRHPGAGSH